MPKITCDREKRQKRNISLNKILEKIQNTSFVFKNLHFNAQGRVNKYIKLLYF